MVDSFVPLCFYDTRGVISATRRGLLVLCICSTTRNAISDRRMAALEKANAKITVNKKLDCIRPSLTQANIYRIDACFYFGTVTFTPVYSVKQ